MFIGLMSFAQDVPVQIAPIEVNGFVLYSRDNGTIVIDRDGDIPKLYELKTPIRYQEGNVYTYFLKPKNCVECTTIEAELLGHTSSVEQTKKNIANMRAKYMIENIKN